MNSAEKELQDSLIIQLCNARTSGYSEKLDQFHSVPRQCTGNLQSCWTSLITDYENFKRIKKKKAEKASSIDNSMCNNNIQSEKKTTHKS